MRMITTMTTTTPAATTRFPPLFTFLRQAPVAADDERGGVEAAVAEVHARG